MPVPHLFCAEVDSIQTTLFRTSGQRQVVGGSSLLATLDQRAPELARERYGVHPDDVLKHGGGSFLIVFPDRDPAVAFGQDLADLYRILLDASITVTEPLPLPGGRDDPNFRDTQKQINSDLRSMKRENRKPVSIAHAPTTAFCQSSGTGLAETYKKPSAISAETEQYLSQYARVAGEAGAAVKKQNLFLDRLYDFLPEIYSDLPLAAGVDAIAALDEARGNVAYLMADANNMGKYFGMCDAQQMIELALALDNAISAAVTAPLEKLVERLSLDEDFLPVLPLILAGDDVFLLLPAFYALDYARQFCLKFEDVMAQQPVVQAVRQVHDELKPDEPSLPNPTLAVCVVICKGNYPYNLVHQQGEKFLKDAKTMIKTTCAGQPTWHSAVALHLITGGELISVNRHTSQCLSTLMPYWVKEGEALESPFKNASLELNRLLASRYRLRDMPQKRQVEVEYLYTPEMLPHNLNNIQASKWMKSLLRLKERMTANDPESPVEATPWETFQSILSALGGEQKAEFTFETGHWRDITRYNAPSKDNDLYYANGIADLLRVWPYAQELKHRLSEYQGKEER